MNKNLNVPSRHAIPSEIIKLPIKVAIVGYGYVGQGTHAALSESDDNSLLEFQIFDGSSNNNFKKFEKITEDDRNGLFSISATDWETTSAVFVCVNTPTHDFTDIESVLHTLSDSYYNGVVAIKCTVPYSVIEPFVTVLNIVMYPEFLTQEESFNDA